MSQEHHTTPLATAYARSIFELADEQHQIDPVEQELEDLADVVDSDRTFGIFLANPSIGEAERGQVIDKVFKGRVSPLVYNFLGVMNRKGRLGLLRQVANAYAQMREQKLGIVEVDVFVAQRLTAEQLEQVRRKASAALKREAVVHQYVDESIIGGVVLRVEDRLLDASVRAQLRAVRRQLLAARPK